jgi:3-hydroxyacyl-CoA dehydrogenase
LEVKIGIQQAGRELVLESAQTPEEVEKVVTAALSDSSGVLQLVDEKGRRVIVPVDKLAYIEIAEQLHRPVGFAPTGRPGA